ncbi:hypothetical protein ACP4OV_017950 [Aristida adscensionis]
MAPACGGGGGRGRSPLSPHLGLHGCVLVACLLCAAQGQQQQPAPERLEVRSYSYASFQRGNSREERELALLRAATINGGALQLTPEFLNVPTTFLMKRAGSVLLRQPFTLWRLDDDGERGRGASGGKNGTGDSGAAGQARRARVVSFNSTFSMHVFYNEELPGEGLAFVIAPSLDGPSPGSYGGYLGLTNATFDASPGKNRFVAVEFDTFNQSYDPPNGNHVGLDIGSVVSNKTANLADFNITTIATTESNAATYTVWIQYDGVARHIFVYMGIRGKPKPTSPVLDSPLDLSEHVPDTAYLGFSASTGVNFEVNCILDWDLTIEVFHEPKSKVWIVLVAVIVPITLVAIGIAAFFLSRILRARRAMEQRQERLEHTLSNLPGMPREFAYDKLRKATNNFHDRQRLGKGGYGEVYKGLLAAAADARSDGMVEVAVKRFIRDDANGVNDFIAEVDIINRLRHKNIVPLIGWCYKKGQLLLVYEFMPKGSLDQHLFRRGVHEQLPVLSWERRYGIVGDVAAGLHYVHHEYGEMMLHRDIKASNVLLDASFRAPLGDFGLARVIDHGRNSVTDVGVAGTRGYIAPEYTMSHRASRQTDVFAFGALVLEVVTGQFALLGNPRYPLLCDWVWQMHGRGALLGAVDQGLGTEDFDADEAARLLLLGLACSSPDPVDRPTMPQVLQILSKAAPPPEVPPSKPKFVWPPEGGANLELSDLEMTTTSGTANGGSSSAMATQDTSYSSFRASTVHNSTEDYFPAISSGR